MQNYALGLDLGTTTSVAAIVDATGRSRTIAGPRGSHLIPSALFFDDGVTVGERALELGQDDPAGLAEGFKRDMGKPHYGREVRFCQIPPEVLSAFLIAHLRDSVGQAVGPPERAVVTVPAFYDEKQRTATQQAARLAGMEVLDIINEPTAAAIAAGYELFAPADARPAGPQSILVYDLGGGTFDVTLLEYEDRVFRAVATDGDILLGGRDFDERLAGIAAQRFLEKHGTDPRTDPRDLLRLWQLARQAKHLLSSQDRCTISVQHAKLSAGVEITREQFEEAIEPLIERSLSTTSDCLRMAGKSWRDLDQFLLVGGSSRIPLIARKVEQLTGRAPRLADNPDDLVAIGAALYAATKSEGLLSDAASRFDVVNVNAHSLGIQGVDPATKQPVNKIIIPRNTPLPKTRAGGFCTRKDGQRNVRVRLLEGESENPKFCTVLGDCIVQIDRPVPKGTDIRVTCQYAANGTITVSARIPEIKASAYVELRRDGYCELESLDVWRARLTTESDIRRSTEVLAASLHRQLEKIDQGSGTLSTSLAKLDALYRFVGQLAADDPPPAQAVQSHRLVHDLQRETETLEDLIQKLDRTYHETRQYQDRLELAGRLAQIKMAWEQSVRLLDHARLALGRECAGENVVPAGASNQLEDIRRLEQTLTEMAAVS